MNDDVYYMKEALKLAKKARNKDEVPIGAIIVKNNVIIAKAYNQKEKKNSATRHAEIEVIEKACKKLNNWYLDECTLYVTLEPCMMCTGAILNSRIDRVVYGASEKRWIALNKLITQTPEKEINHHPVIVSDILEEECSHIITDYFKEKRKKK